MNNIPRSIKKLPFSPFPSLKKKVGGLQILDQSMWIVSWSDLRDFYTHNLPLQGWRGRAHRSTYYQAVHLHSKGDVKKAFENTFTYLEIFTMTTIFQLFCLLIPPCCHTLHWLLPTICGLPVYLPRSSWQLLLRKKATVSALSDRSLWLGLRGKLPKHILTWTKTHQNTS